MPLLSACLGADVAADSISTDAGDPFPAGPGVLPLLSRCAPFADSELGRQFLDGVAEIHIPPERPLLYSC